MVFPVVMYGSDIWTIKAESQRIMFSRYGAGQSPWDSKEIKPVNLKGNQPWILIGRTNAEAEALVLWPPDVKSWLFGKDPGAGKDWRQKEKTATEDEMVGWHHWFNEHELGQAQGDGEGQEGLACCSPQGHKEWTWLGDWTTTISVYVSMLLSQFVLPSLSPTVSTSRLNF